MPFYWIAKLIEHLDEYLFPKEKQKTIDEQRKKIKRKDK